MRVFLTGVTGYVGSRVAELLILDGNELAVMVRGDADDAAARRLGAWPMRAALDDPARLRAIASEVDAVVHCAASDRPDFLPVNRRAVDALLAGLRPGCGFVAHGGTLVFGDTAGRTFDGSELYAPPPPLAGRAALDAAVLEAGRRRGLRTAVVHSPLVYGGTGAAIPGLLVGAALRTGRVGVPGGVDPVWATVHVADWACLVVQAALRTPVGGNAYVAAGSHHRLADVGAAIADALGLGPPVPVTPAEAADLWAPLGPALFLDQRFRHDRAEAMLDWVPSEDDPLGEIARLATVMRAGAGG